MAADRSELSSLSAMLLQLTQRISAMAEASSAAHDGEEAKELFGIERGLVGAQRRLDRLISGRR